MDYVFHSSKGAHNNRDNFFHKPLYKCAISSFKYWCLYFISQLPYVPWYRYIDEPSYYLHWTAIIIIIKNLFFFPPPEKRIWLIIRKFPWFHRRQESWNRHIKKYWKCPLERAQSRAKFLPSFVTYDGLIFGAIKKWPIESFLHVFKTRLDFTKAFVRK